MSAELFCAARGQKRGLAAWPGDLPATLDAAYAMQAECIAGWDDRLAGLKVGRIMAPDAEVWGTDRFIGPIFAQTIQRDGRDAVLPVIAGGTALLECEIQMVLGAGADQAVADERAMRSLVTACHVGIEVAGSPVADINALGPLASVACFGNNNGAILGPVVPDWRDLDLDGIGCVARIDGEVVGTGSANRLPGGVWTAARFAVNEAARRGLHLTPGAVLCLGALTGMHPVQTGQVVEADFGPLGRVECCVAVA